MMGITSSEKSGGSLGIFTYNITHAPDHTLQWNPPPNSKELAIALSYHFPLEPDLESKMRAAMIKFLSGQAPPPSSNQVSHRYLTPEDEEAPIISGPSKRSPKVKEKPHEKPQLKVVAWGPGNGPRGGFDKREVKRRRYQTEEGAKVAKNRGYACERHRRQKLKCDPDTCPSNKQRLVNSSAKPGITAQDQTDLPPNLDFEVCQSESLALAPTAGFPDDAFQGKEASGWDDYSPMSFTSNMDAQQITFRSSWQSEPHSIGDASWNTPLDVSLSETNDLMMLDSNYAFDNTVGNSDISFSWQGSSNFDPGIFFIPSASGREACLPTDVISKYPLENFSNPMVQTDFNSCHSLVFPTDTITASELQYDQPIPLTRSSSSQENFNNIIKKTTVNHSVDAKATPWYFSKMPKNENGDTVTTITIGAGDNACSTTFTNKADFVEKLKMLIPHPEFYFSVPNLVQDPEQLASFCRGTYGKKKGKAS